MPSALSRILDYENIAEKYSTSNEIQVDFGKRFFLKLGVQRGVKVLDMGCGTGEITAFIADQVGGEGRVEGVDPDQQRIKVAMQKNYENRIRSNISYEVGDSSSQLKEEFYDIHFSNLVFHWLTNEEKEIFLQTAFKCLKPSGLLAIQCNESIPQIMNELYGLLSDDENTSKPPLQYLTKSAAESLIGISGFEIVSSEYVETDHTFQSLDCFLTWCCASQYIDKSKILQKETFAMKFVNDDGTVRILGPTFVYRIIARKASSRDS